MSPQEVKDSSFLEITRMLDEFTDMNSAKPEKLPVGTEEF